MLHRLTLSYKCHRQPSLSVSCLFSSFDSVICHSTVSDTLGIKSVNLSLRFINPCFAYVAFTHTNSVVYLVSDPKSLKKIEARHKEMNELKGEEFFPGTWKVAASYVSVALSRPKCFRLQDLLNQAHSASNRQSCVRKWRSLDLPLFALLSPQEGCANQNSFRWVTWNHSFAPQYQTDLRNPWQVTRKWLPLSETRRPERYFKVPTNWEVGDPSWHDLPRHSRFPTVSLQRQQARWQEAYRCSSEPATTRWERLPFLASVLAALH